MEDLGLDWIWQALEQVADPEIPAISVVDLGLIRNVAVDTGVVVVTMTPTFAGCPALRVMRAEIEQRLLAAGAQQVRVRLALAPPWSSDRITVRGRERLKQFGLAPPPMHAGNLDEALLAGVQCPFCDALDTERKNDFGPTLCRAIYVCHACGQPFEQFKPV